MTKLVSLPQESRGAYVWRKIRSGLMFGIAVVTSPCCTPLYVPLALLLLAGTPIAAWLSVYMGWVYGGLTVVSLISLGLGLRWLWQKNASKHTANTTHKSALNLFLR